ncbi:MAG: hypothetical protein K8R59_10070 [Thermoanaerobaculales bacterium]|nr:hypothetical protein [Thermoanaerobaculales bacterium]
MSDTESRASQKLESRRSRFGAFHARTYEMELLVSGAVVFGLIHLPPVFERMFTSFRASLEGNLRLIGILGQGYLQLVLYGLIAVFVLHLALRGFWIGLLGLESVFPEGIRWDRVKLGPATIRRYRAGFGSLAEVIEKVDDLCSLVFSFGFLVVFIWIYFAVLLVVTAAFGFGFSWLFLGGRGASTVFWIVGGSIIGFPMMTDLIDKTLGQRVRSGGMVERIIEVMVGIAYTISPMRFIGAIQLTLGSNLSNTKASIVLVGFMFALAFVQIGGGFLGQGVVRLDSLTFFPDSLREQGMDPRHYRALRDPDAVEPLIPTIQSDCVADPYLKLFIPYNPRRHNHLVTEACPDLSALSKNGLDAGKGANLEDTQVQEAAACLGSLFSISLDGESVKDIHFDFTIEQGTGLEGLVSFLSVDELERGRHELMILAPPKVRLTDEDEKTPDPVRHLIPFWL